MVARAFHGHHAGAHGGFGGADLSKERTFTGGNSACDHLAAMTARGELILGKRFTACIQMGKLLPQTQTASLDHAQSAPCGIGGGKIAIHTFHRLDVT